MFLAFGVASVACAPIFYLFYLFYLLHYINYRDKHTLATGCLSHKGFILHQSYTKATLSYTRGESK